MPKLGCAFHAPKELALSKMINRPTKPQSMAASPILQNTPKQQIRNQ